ncbi:MAG: nucleoside-triphosphatase [Kiritimatiellae bacterium]|nr:nucleoside-triphosphatase [Kiritimatiellia bacterium]
MTSKNPCDRLILTGPMQSGKSTVVRQILAQLEPGRLGGFQTEPLPEGRRVGFQIGPWDGVCVPFVRFSGQANALWNPQVDASVFSNQAAGWLRAAVNADWCVLDELGILEQGIDAFVQEVNRVASSTVPMLAVIQERALPFWMEHLPQDRCRIYRLDAGNRDSLNKQLANELKQARLNRLSG